MLKTTSHNSQCALESDESADSYLMEVVYSMNDGMVDYAKGNKDLLEITMMK